MQETSFTTPFLLSSFSLEELSFDISPSLCSACPLISENLRLRQQAGYWKSQHQRATQREAKLKEENRELKARIRQLESQLYGRKTEKHATSEQSSFESSTSQKKRPRGHQRGQPGHARRDYSHLPVVEEFREIPKDERICSDCRLPYEAIGKTEDSEQIEIEVKAHRRIIRRKQYQKTCTCPEQPTLITTPPAPKLIPKGKLGISIWTLILLEKFHLMRPMNRVLQQLSLYELDIPIGTVTDGLKKIAPLFEPIYQAIIDYHLSQNRFHADETRWQVFAKIEDKMTYRWYLWVFASHETVVYILDPSRASKVPEEHFGTQSKGFLNVDRYSAYKTLKTKGVELILAFCWSHVRRDFLNIHKSWDELQDWAMMWVKIIARVYHINNQRIALPKNSPEWEKANDRLIRFINWMQKKWESELKENPIHPAKKKVLNSLKEHWEGLTVFVEHHEIPMDNNQAERLLRNPVVGRKNFYGSQAIWSGQLLVMLMSIFQTLKINNVNLRVWLTQYLFACTENNGKPPEDIEPFLPWKINSQQFYLSDETPEINDSS